MKSIESFLKRDNKLILAGFAVVVFLILYLQANIGLWRGHLEIDTWVWYQRIDQFRNSQSFAGLINNEYLPAALFYFLLPGSVLGLSSLSYSKYLGGVVIVSFVILGLELLLVRKRSSNFKALVFLMTILFMGPILLFRFDPFVSLLLVMGLLFWRDKRFWVAGFFLGWAAAVKVFPLILVPYFGSVLWFKYRNLKKVFGFLVAWGTVGIISGAGFLLLGGRVEQIALALEFHADKYVSIESMPGVILTGISLLTNKTPLPLLGGYGIWGVKSELIDRLGMGFFNYLWLVPLCWFYFYLLRQKRWRKKVQPGVVFWMILLFLVFAKSLNPQYLFWFVALFPFLKVKPQGEGDYWVMFCLILIIAYLNQLVYPLLYTNLIEDFYRHGTRIEIYWLQLLRNLTIVLLLVVSFRNIFIKKSIE